MISKIFASAFVFYQLSSGSSRILLQQIPQIPQIPAQPAVIPEAPPVISLPPLDPLPQHVSLPPQSSATLSTLPVDPLYVPPEHETTKQPLVSSTSAPIISTSSTTTAAPEVISTSSTTTTTAAPVVLSTTTTTTAPAPVAPDGFQFGAFAQLCPILTPTLNTRQAQCVLATDVLTDADTGSISCTQSSDCCMCSSIECGLGSVSCSTFRAGPSAVFGVQDITISGADVGAGAVIECQGVDACRQTNIDGRNILEIDCTAVGSCQDAVITVNDPKPNFIIECAGTSSCAGLKLEINFSGPPAGYMCAPLAASATKNVFIIGGIECNGESACEGVEITINNAGCNHVLIDTVECLMPNACNGAVFNLIGDIDIHNCQCGPSCSNAHGLDKCFQNLEYLLCPDPLSCSAISKTITNPANDFEMMCSNTQSCENANFHFEIVASTSTMFPATQWKGFTFRGLNAARGATFTIDNQLMSVLDVDVINCRGVGSCLGSTFITGANVIIEDVYCAAGACAGCVIKESVADVGVPCDPRQVVEPQLIQQIPSLPSNAAPIVEVPQIPQTPQTPVIPQTPQAVPNGPWIPI